MSSFEEILNKLNSQTDLGYATLRIYIGIALFSRAVLMLADPSAITRLSGAQDVYWWYAYVIGGHMVGGLLLALGFLTRLAALIQIPILVGAVFFIHLQQGLMTVGQSLELSALVLAILLIYFVFGSGSFSLDENNRQKKMRLLHSR